VRVGEVVGQALVQSQEVVREVTERRGAREQCDARVRGQSSQGFSQPLRRGAPFDGGSLTRIIREQRAAELVLLIAQHDARAARGGGRGSGEPGRARAHDEHVAVGVARGVAVGVGLGGSASEAGGGANARLVERLPRAPRPHEGLVVKPGRNERSEQIVDGAEVEGKARPAILTVRFESLVQLDLGGAQVGRVAGGVAAHGHKRVGLLGSGCEHTTRAVILERAAHQVHAVGEQRRGERVPGNTGVSAPVEAEMHGARAVDTPALQGAQALVHGRTGAAAVGTGSPTL